MDRPLCLIGMSGVGKSHWAAQLAAEHGFTHHDCDAAIAARLGEVVTPNPGESPVNALGRWMGAPWSEGFTEREALDLELEGAVTREALSAALAGEGPQVIDTTGSVIYLDDGFLAELRDKTRVVYLSTPESARATMLERYLSDPKPTLFGDLFERREGEAPEAALPRCYAALLEWRHRRYAQLAHVVLDGHALGEDGAERILSA